MYFNSRSQAKEFCMSKNFKLYESETFVSKSKILSKIWVFEMNLKGCKWQNAIRNYEMYKFLVPVPSVYDKINKSINTDKIFSSCRKYVKHRIAKVNYVKLKGYRKMALFVQPESH